MDWRACAAAIFVGIVSVGAAAAQTAGDQSIAGRAYAERSCASCHAVGPAGRSPLKAAPPFRELMARYPAENLEEALAEGIVVGHPAMPNFKLEQPERGDLIAYLRTLQPKR